MLHTSIAEIGFRLLKLWIVNIVQNLEWELSLNFLPHFDRMRDTLGPDSFKPNDLSLPWSTSKYISDHYIENRVRRLVQEVRRPYHMSHPSSSVDNGMHFYYLNWRVQPVFLSLLISWFTLVIELFISISFWRSSGKQKEMWVLIVFLLLMFDCYNTASPVVSGMY